MAKMNKKLGNITISKTFRAVCCVLMFSMRARHLEFLEFYYQDIEMCNLERSANIIYSRPHMSDLQPLTSSLNDID